LKKNVNKRSSKPTRRCKRIIVRDTILALKLCGIARYAKRRQLTTDKPWLSKTTKNTALYEITCNESQKLRDSTVSQKEKTR
jgi:hypothetical protein